MIRLIQISLLAWLIPLTSPGNDDRILRLHFENIQSGEGTILVGVYTDERGWNKKVPTVEYVISKENLSKGKLDVSIDGFDKGVYALAVLDDTNSNQIVDMGFIFPKEGFGFSNYEHRSLRLPKFREFNFAFPEIKEVKIKMRYLNY